MAREKTHSQDPGCSPAREKEAGRGPPAPPEGVLALSCPWDSLCFSLPQFLKRAFSGFVLHLVR